mgnify:CR=1 FL=1
MRYIGFHHLEESLYLDCQEELVLARPLIAESKILSILLWKELNVENRLWLDIIEE